MGIKERQERDREAVRRAILDAARAGDVRSYLASYTGQMDSALKQSLAETTEDRFAR